MSTIEELLDTWRTAEDAIPQVREDAHIRTGYASWYNPGPGIEAEQLARDAHCAITEPWTLALEAMKATVRDNIDTAHGAHYCFGCRSDLPNHRERHTPDTCPVAACQAAIAAMEGMNEHD